MLRCQNTKSLFEDDMKIRIPFEILPPLQMILFIFLFFSYSFWLKTGWQPFLLWFCLRSWVGTSNKDICYFEICNPDRIYLEIQVYSKAIAWPIFRLHIIIKKQIQLGNVFCNDWRLKQTFTMKPKHLSNRVYFWPQLFHDIFWLQGEKAVL